MSLHSASSNLTFSAITVKRHVVVCTVLQPLLPLEFLHHRIPSLIENCLDNLSLKAAGHAARSREFHPIGKLFRNHVQERHVCAQRGWFPPRMPEVAQHDLYLPHAAPGTETLPFLPGKKAWILITFRITITIACSNNTFSSGLEPWAVEPELSEKQNRVAHQDLFEVGRQVLQPKPFRPITAPYRSRRLEPQSTHRATRRAAPPEIQLGWSRKGTSSSWPPHRSRGPERSSPPCPSTW